MPTEPASRGAAAPAALEATLLPEDVLSSPLYNHDLAPTPPDQRTWGRWNIAALWIGMSVNIYTYVLGAQLLKLGMNWWQAVVTILLGNLVVLVPMCLNAHAGTRYGIPFPVLIRASFGTKGSNIPAMARAIVACGWFGLQTWIGGEAIYELLALVFPSWRALAPLPYLGINAAVLSCFLVFWAINVYFIVRGTEGIKLLETLSAPFLIVIGIALLAWGIHAGGSLSHVLDQSELFTRPTVALTKDPTGAPALRIRSLDRATRYRMGTARGEEKVDWGEWRDLAPRVTEIVSAGSDGASLRVQFADGASHVSTALSPAPATTRSFWELFLPGLTAMVCFWATLSLNIPDFTRYARSQRDQVLGQLIGLPTTMAFYSFIGIAVTCAALIAFPEVLVQEDAPWEPVKLLGHFTSPPLVILSLLALGTATLTCNIAANVVSPANDISNLAPKRVSFLAGGIITAFVGLLMQPWKLIASTKGFIFTWLLGYGVLLGPIAGIMIADYFVVKRARLDVADLYRERGRYGRWNLRSIAIFAAAVAPCVPGFLVEAHFAPAERVPALFQSIYTYAWFVGFGIAFLLHALFGTRALEDKES